MAKKSTKQSTKGKAEKGSKPKGIDLKSHILKMLMEHPVKDSKSKGKTLTFEDIIPKLKEKGYDFHKESIMEAIKQKNGAMKDIERIYYQYRTEKTEFPVDINLFDEGDYFLIDSFLEEKCFEQFIEQIDKTDTLEEAVGQIIKYIESDLPNLIQSCSEEKAPEKEGAEAYIHDSKKPKQEKKEPSEPHKFTKTKTILWVNINLWSGISAKVELFTKQSDSNKAWAKYMGEPYSKKNYDAEREGDKQECQIYEYAQEDLKEVLNLKEFYIVIEASEGIINGVFFFKSEKEANTKLAKINEGIDEGKQESKVFKVDDPHFKSKNPETKLQLLDQATCPHESITTHRKEVNLIEYFKGEDGFYHENKETSVDSEIESAECLNCGKKFTEEEIGNLF
jgi:hypothetical protein